jgi:hypothetical protein
MKCSPYSLHLVTHIQNALKKKGNFFSFTSRNRESYCICPSLGVNISLLLNFCMQVGASKTAEGNGLELHIFNGVIGGDCLRPLTWILIELWPFLTLEKSTLCRFLFLQIAVLQKALVFRSPVTKWQGELLWSLFVRHPSSVRRT